ncbi:hypothetical protein BGZ63DRAFT_436775 [Mariannaea sp. PMI_226]|nr:hypothetical protein BGZ63DRAFT_436775 [Mariannaea sp. PMI_226]
MRLRNNLQRVVFIGELRGWIHQGRLTLIITRSHDERPRLIRFLVKQLRVQGRTDCPESTALTSNQADHGIEALVQACSARRLSIIEVHPEVALLNISTRPVRCGRHKAYHVDGAGGHNHQNRTARQLRVAPSDEQWVRCDAKLLLDTGAGLLNTSPDSGQILSKSGSRSFLVRYSPISFCVI